MADAAVRVTGVVLGVDERSGVKVSETNPQGKAWRMRQAKVLVADRDLARVTLSDRVADPVKGEVVDWYVEVRGGRFLNLDYVDEWKNLSQD